MSNQTGKPVALSRAEIEALPYRMTVPFTMQAVEEDGDRLRVKGVMHSFGKTYSKRMLHPEGFKRWLERNAGRNVKMLAQHGYVMATFAAIGQWDEIGFDPKVGAVWSGWIGGGEDMTALQEEVRKLARQGLLDQLSWGWAPIEARWVTLNDNDLDPHFKKVMEENEWAEALGYFDYDVVEGSWVDIADDPGARRLAAQFREDVASELLKPLTARIDGIAATLNDIAGRLTQRELFEEIKKINRSFFAEAIAEWKNQALEVLESLAVDPEAEYAAGLLDEDADASSCTHGESGQPDAPAGQSESAELLARLRAVNVD